MREARGAKATVAARRLVDAVADPHLTTPEGARHILNSAEYRCRCPKVRTLGFPAGG